jgi:two-component system, NarL family, nitrate/nitrite response regulator NarL
MAWAGLGPSRVKRVDLVSKIELLLHSWLVKDALSFVLMEAGFTVFHEASQHDDATIVVVDFEDCKDRENMRAHQSRGARIVALTSEVDSREIAPDELVLLSGILTYDLSAAAFVRSLHLIGSGERVFPRDLVMGRRPQPSTASIAHRSDGVGLSPREREILSHLVEGRSNKEIARYLDITEATVKVHLKSVLRKIKVENRTQAAIWALANLPDPETIPPGFV